MPLTLEPPVVSQISVAPDPLAFAFEPETHRVLWTRAAACALIEAGRIDGARYELLGGELYQKVKNQPHVLAVGRTGRRLQLLFGPEMVLMEGPVSVTASDTSANDPEPDVTLLTRSLDTFVDAPPGAEDARLIVEVADSTLRRDLGEKAALYARAGFSEYWVLDLTNRCLHVHREPSDSTYQSIVVFDADAAVSPLAAPDSSFAVSDLLPPPPVSPAATE